MSEDRFEGFLRDAAREYNRPPDTPREQIWGRIEETRREGRQDIDRPTPERWRRGLDSPWVRWGLGLAAALLIGIGIGRVSLRGPAVEVGPVAEEPVEGDRGGEAYRLAATDHLARAEALLTAFRSAPGAGEGEFWASAADLLAGTRLLLDSPAAQDPRMRALLEELELILAQIAVVQAETSPGDVKIIQQALERRGLLPRLRTVVPAGSSVSG